jgi:SPP1 gp7 family putative phage head morphogenesis protein
MRFDLASRLRRPSRKPIALAKITTTKAQEDALFALYQRATAAWTAGSVRINAAYAKTLSELATDTADDIRSALDAIAAEIQRLVILLTPDLRQWALSVERVQRGKFVSSVLSATAVDLDTILTAGDVEDTLAAQIEWNVSLIRDVSDQARRRIANAIFAGLQQRTPAAAIAREIRDGIGIERARARRIAGDQTVKLGERLNRARQQQAGLTHFKWRHSAKRHPRIWHEARDGKVYPWEGSGIPADDMPGVPPFCGCTAQGVVVFEE